MAVLIQLVSIVGACLILLAFVAVQRRWWAPEGSWYLWANLLGAVLLGIVAVANRSIGFVLLESVWAGVALWSLIRPRRKVPEGEP